MQESQSLVRNQRVGLLLSQFCLASCIIGTIMGLGYYYLQENTQPTQGNKMLYQSTKSTWMSMVTGFPFYLFIYKFHLTLYFILPLDPLPCLSPACVSLAERFSAAMDPFSLPCDYYLFSCKAESSPKSRGRHRGNILSQNVTRRDEMRMRKGRGGWMRLETGSDTETKTDDRLPDRQTSLLLAIKEILGMMHTVSFNRCMHH